MDSAGSPNAWAPYDSNRDCSQGICSVYCPQWCYYILPPPPPDEGSGTTFSPLIIAIIGILGSAFLLVSYYTFITKYCRRRGHGNPDFEAHHDEMAHDQWLIGSTGLDDGLIKSITVFKYNKGEGLVEGTECSVCLNEFLENENLRLMPKCCHAFHPPCIDTWLKSHTNCPLCRANAAPTFSLPLPVPPPQTSSTVNISARQVQRQNDLAMVIDERESSHDQEELFVNCVSPKSPHQANGNLDNSEVGDGRSGDQEEVRPFRRSISLGAFSPQLNLLVADILKIDEDEKNSKISQLEMGIGSSKGIREEQSKSNYINRNSELARSPVAIKRSFSTGRFTFTRQDRGKNYIISS